MNLTRMVLVGTLLSLSLVQAWSIENKDSPADLALSFFNQGIRSLEAGEETSARELFAKAAQAYEQGAVTENPQLWYETGNARWWAKDYPGAIVAYRRYLAISPWDPRAWGNLASARDANQTQGPGNEGLSSWPWHMVASYLGAILGSLGLLLLGLWFINRRRKFMGAGLIVLTTGIILGFVALLSLELRPNLVVLAMETQGHQGDAGVYARSPNEPWKAGQEAWVLETRDTWTRLRVGTQESWVPTSSLIHP